MKEAVPEVSAIVTTFNRKELLLETLRAILAQTFRDFELLVIDNESVDGTEEAVRSLGDPRIRYYRNANGGRVSVNRNFGIRKSKGKWIAFCDDDDLWAPEKLETQIGWLNAHEGYDLSCANVRLFDSKGALGNTRKYWFRFKSKNLEAAFKLNFVYLSSSVVSWKAAESVGGFDESPEFVSMEDYEFWIRVLKKHRCHYHPRVLVFCRKADANHSSLSSDLVEQSSRTITMLEKKLKDPGYPSGVISKSLSRLYLKHFLLEIGEKNVYCGSYLLKSLQYNRFNLGGRLLLLMYRANRKAIPRLYALYRFLLVKRV